MAAAGYPNLDQHQHIHEALIDSIFQLHQSYSEGNVHLEIDTMKFVRNWIIGYILKNDYLFRDFLKQKFRGGGGVGFPPRVKELIVILLRSRWNSCGTHSAAFSWIFWPAT